MLSCWGKAPKTVLGGGLACAVLRIGLWVDGVTQLLGHIGTKIRHRALDLPQETPDLVLFWGPSLVLGAMWLLALLALVFRLLVLVCAWILALAAIAVRVLILVLGVVLREMLDGFSSPALILEHTPGFPDWP